MYESRHKGYKLTSRNLMSQFYNPSPCSFIDNWILIQYSLHRRLSRLCRFPVHLMQRPAVGKHCDKLCLGTLETRSWHGLESRELKAPHNTLQPKPSASWRSPGNSHSGSTREILKRRGQLYLKIKSKSSSLLFLCFFKANTSKLHYSDTLMAVLIMSLKRGPLISLL